MTLTRSPDALRNDAIDYFVSLRFGLRDPQCSNVVRLTDDEAVAKFGIPGRSINAEFGDELLKWKQAFAGKSEITFLHAALVIAIRRRIDLEENLSAYYALWDDSGPFLLQHLDLKWLTSACDTFLDHPRSSAERAWALCGALLAKTVKVYETEHRLYVSPGTQRAPFKKEILFDGLLNYSVGGGDLITNLERRVSSIDQTEPPSRVVREMFRRMLDNDTAFRRIR